MKKAKLFIDTPKNKLIIGKTYRDTGSEYGYQHYTYLGKWKEKDVFGFAGVFAYFGKIIDGKVKTFECIGGYTKNLAIKPDTNYEERRQKTIATWRYDESAKHWHKSFAKYLLHVEKRVPEMYMDITAAEIITHLKKSK